MATGQTLLGSVTGPTLPVPGGRGVRAPAPVQLYRESVARSAVFDAAGEAVVIVGSPPVDGWWLVERLIVVSESTTATEARVYVGEVSPANLQDGTVDGNLDVAEYPNGLYVTGGAPLVVVWSGGDPGAAAHATAQLRVERGG